MKRRLLATVAAVPLMTGHAHAQLAVICPECAKEWTQIAGWAKQASDVLEQIQWATNQYHMLNNTYNAIAHATDVQGVAAALGGVTYTYLPEASEAVNFVAGSGSIYGIASGLRTAGRYADVGDDTPWAREMQRRELATANVKSIAHRGLEDIGARLEHLGELVGLISAAEDGTAVSAHAAAVNVEQSNIGNHQAQLQQMALMLAGENRVDVQRAEQMQWESARQLREATQPLGGGR
jgi:hypothetical protein